MVNFIFLLLLNFIVPLYSWKNIIGINRPVSVTALQSYDSSRKYQIPSSFFENYRVGKITSIELEKIFAPSRQQLEIIKRSSSKGFAGFVFNMDSVLVDSFQFMDFAYASFAPYLGMQAPDAAVIRDTLGMTFRDVATQLGWSVRNGKHLSLEDWKKDEENFHFILRKLLSSDFPAHSHPGANELLDEIIKDDNGLVLISSLPQDIAIKILQLTQLAQVLEGRVSINHLLTIPPYPDTPTSNNENYLETKYPRHGDRFQQQQYLRACACLQRPPMLTIAIENNRHFVTSAKKSGLACIAIKGTKSFGTAQYFRGCDRIVPDLDDVDLSDAYRLVRDNIRKTLGPEAATDTQVSKVNPRVQHVASIDVEPGSPEEQRMLEDLAEQNEQLNKSALRRRNAINGNRSKDIAHDE